MASKRASGGAGAGQPAHEIYLQLVEEREHGYFHLRGRFVTQRYENHEWICYGVDDDYSDGLLWTGLRTSCQGDERSRRREGESADQPVYGFDCEYRDSYSLGLRKVRRMVKTLEKLDKGLDKLREARGYVKSYGEYCGRVAEVFGCKGIVVLQPERERYSGQRWNWMSIGDGVNTANRMIWQWVEEGRPKAETEALPAASMRDGADVIAETETAAAAEKAGRS